MYKYTIKTAKSSSKENVNIIITAKEYKMVSKGPQS